MGDMCDYDHHKNTSLSATSPPNSSSSSQDEISLFLRQILLRSSSSLTDPDNNADSSKPHANENALSSFRSSPLQDGISFIDSNRASVPVSGAYTSVSNIKGQGCSAANVSSSSVGVSENENDDYDCESEEGVDALAEEVPTKAIPSRTSSKRSRAAEVHNLSEKRRRSRINEKMKALQNLIPNSNKMLSMRNGLSLHPLCCPEGLQHQQLSRMRMELGEENRSFPLNMTTTLPLQQENPLHYASDLPNKRTVLDQPSVPYPSHIINSVTSFGLESPILSHIKSFLPGRSEICREDILQHQQSIADHSDTNPLGPLAPSALKDNSSLESCIVGRDHSGLILSNSEPNITHTSQLSR